MLKEDEAKDNACSINWLVKMEAPWRPFPFPVYGLIRLCLLKTLEQRCHGMTPFWGMVTYTVLWSPLPSSLWGCLLKDVAFLFPLRYFRVSRHLICFLNSSDFHSILFAIHSLIPKTTSLTYSLLALKVLILLSLWYSLRLILTVIVLLWASS